MMNAQAVYTLYPQVVKTVEDEAFDKDGNKVEIDLVAVNAWVDPNAYKSKRQAEYPPIGDQLDALYKAGVFPAELAAQIKAVKDKYPKGAS
jgi:hypothetical protein